jgi:toxin ParE1/3/4
MVRVIHTRLAKQDLRGIWHYIAQHSERAADRMLDKIAESCNQLAIHPGMGEVFRRTRREVRRFPIGNYVIYYEPTDQGVRILRVLHAAREHEKEV